MKTVSSGSRRPSSGLTIPTWLRWKRSSALKSSWRRKKGVNLSYLDTHYVMPYNEHYRPIVERLGKKYGLPVSCLLGEHELDDFGIYSAPPEEKEKALERVLRNLKPGVNLLIGHPGLSSLENDALIHYDPKDVQTMGTGRLRAAETLAYTSPRIKRWSTSWASS